MKKDTLDKLIEVLQVLAFIVFLLVLGGAVFYSTYLEWDTKIKIHETYSTAAENVSK